MNAPETATDAAPALPVGRYRIDPTRTTVQLHTRHLLGLGAVTGTVALREADLSVGAQMRVHAVVDAASFETGNHKRDAEVRSAKYLDVSTYPDITFDAQQLRQRDGQWVATGTLTAHGTAAPADLRLDDLHRTDAGELVLRASTTINRYAHQVTAGKGLAARRLTIVITATATPVQDAPS
jgi:polyisoprenoid-binding protein YceI